MPGCCPLARKTRAAYPRYVSMFDAGSGQETDIGLIKYRDRYSGMPGFCALPRKTRAAYPRYVSTIDAGRAQKTGIPGDREKRIGPGVGRKEGETPGTHRADHCALIEDERCNRQRSEVAQPTLVIHNGLPVTGVTPAKISLPEQNCGDGPGMARARPVHPCAPWCHSPCDG